MLIVSFWKEINFNVGLINFIVEKIFICTLNIFRCVIPLEGCSSIVTGVVLRMLIMTAAVFISIILCVIVLVVSTVDSESFSVTMSISENVSSLFFHSSVVTFLEDGSVLLLVSKVVVYFFVAVSFSISSSIIWLGSSGWPIGWLSGFYYHRAGTLKL